MKTHHRREYDILKKSGICCKLTCLEMKKDSARLTCKLLRTDLLQSKALTNIHFLFFSVRCIALWSFLDVGRRHLDEFAILLNNNTDENEVNAEQYTRPIYYSVQTESQLFPRLLYPC